MKQNNDTYQNKKDIYRYLAISLGVSLGIGFIGMGGVLLNNLLSEDNEWLAVNESEEIKDLKNEIENNIPVDEVVEDPKKYDPAPPSPQPIPPPSPQPTPPPAPKEEDDVVVDGGDNDDGNPIPPSPVQNDNDIVVNKEGNDNGASDAQPVPEMNIDHLTEQNEELRAYLLDENPEFREMEIEIMPDIITKRNEFTSVLEANNIDTNEYSNATELMADNENNFEDVYLVISKYFEAKMKIKFLIEKLSVS